MVVTSPLAPFNVTPSTAVRFTAPEVLVIGFETVSVLVPPPAVSVTVPEPLALIAPLVVIEPLVVTTLIEPLPPEVVSPAMSTPSASAMLMSPLVELLAVRLET